jgi:hydroxypyruvate isomerase
MLRFAANIGSGSITKLFGEYPFLERFDRAAAAGFEAVEYPEPYGYDVRAIRAALDRTGLRQVQFNLPWGDHAAGDRGIAHDPRRRAEFRDGVARALDVADLLDCPRLLCPVGVLRPEVAADVQWGTAVENLRYTVEQAVGAGRRILIEPLNPLDVPGSLLTTMTQAVRLLEEVGHPDLRILCDVYHLQRTEGNLTATILEHLARIDHFEIADVPGRHQPGTGEINYRFVLGAIEQAGFEGWVCPEYVPLGGTEPSLQWLRDWGYWP